MSKENITTVKEFIAILQKMPHDLPILIDGYETGFENICPPEIMKIKRIPDNPYYNGEFQDAEEGDKNTFDAVVLQRVVRDE